MSKDWIVYVYEGQNLIMDIGLIGNTEEEAIENARSDLIVNLDYDPERVKEFRYEAKLDPNQEGTTMEEVHQAMITIADYDTNLLSYEGQTLWNKLAEEAEKNGDNN